MKLNERNITDLRTHADKAIRESAEEFASIHIDETFGITHLIGVTDHDDVDDLFAAFVFADKAEDQLDADAREALGNLWRDRGELETLDRKFAKARHLADRAHQWGEVRDRFKKLTTDAQVNAVSAAYHKLLDGPLKDAHHIFTINVPGVRTDKNHFTGETEERPYRSLANRDKDYKGRSYLSFDAHSRRQEVTWSQIGTAIKNALMVTSDEAKIESRVSRVDVVVDSNIWWREDCDLPERERFLRNCDHMMGRRSLGIIRRIK